MLILIEFWLLFIIKWCIAVYMDCMIKPNINFKLLFWFTFKLRIFRSKILFLFRNTLYDISEIFFSKSLYILWASWVIESIITFSNFCIICFWNLHSYIIFKKSKLSIYVNINYCNFIFEMYLFSMHYACIIIICTCESLFIE